MGLAGDLTTDLALDGLCEVQQGRSPLGVKVCVSTREEVQRLVGFGYSFGFTLVVRPGSVATHLVFCVAARRPISRVRLRQRQ